MWPEAPVATSALRLQTTNRKSPTTLGLTYGTPTTLLSIHDQVISRHTEYNHFHLGYSRMPAVTQHTE